MKEFFITILSLLFNFLKFFVFGVSLVVAVTVSYVYPTVLIGALLFAFIASIVQVFIHNK